MCYWQVKARPLGERRSKKSSVSIVVNSLQFLQNGKDEQKPSKQEDFAPENFEGNDILF